MARRSSGRRNDRASGGSRSRSRSTTRHYPRTARLNALLTEIVADYFKTVEEDALGFLTITGVEVDSDLNVAQVFFSILGDDLDGDPDADQRVLDVIEEHRRAVQRAIGTQAKLRKTPDVLFAFDPAVRSGARIESILADLDENQASQDGDPLP